MSKTTQMTLLPGAGERKRVAETERSSGSGSESCLCVQASDPTGCMCQSDTLPQSAPKLKELQMGGEKNSDLGPET